MSEVRTRSGNPLAVNLIVDISFPAAAAKLEAFGLTQNDWQIRTFDTANNGRRFERVVVVLPERATPALMDRVQHLRSVVTPEGKLNFI